MGRVCIHWPLVSAFLKTIDHCSGQVWAEDWLNDQWEGCIVLQSTNQRPEETREKNWQFRENWLALTHKFCQFVFVFHRISVYPFSNQTSKKKLPSLKDSCCQTYQRIANDMEFFHHDLMLLENLMKRIFDFLLSAPGDQCVSLQWGRVRGTRPTLG